MPPIHRVLEHGTRALVALLALALVALGLAACGDEGGGGGSAVDAQTLLTRTFGGTHKIDSGRADLRIVVTAQGAPSLRGPIKLAVAGPFQSAGANELPTFDLALDISAQGQSFKAGLTSTSDRLFVGFGGAEYEVPGTLLAQMRESFKQSRSSGGTMSLERLGLHPIRWIEDPTVVGRESVGGVETEHVSGELDVDAILDDVDTLLAKVRQQGLAGAGGQRIPDGISAKDREQIEDAVTRADVDVWSGVDDRTLRKLQLALTIEPPNPSDDGPSRVEVEISFELRDLNEPQTIEAPASSRPLSELLGQFQGLLGGALGGSGSSSGSGSGSSNQIDAYTQCLQDAGRDLAKAQRCASLLTE